ncbi:hypothetical protein GNP79_12150 [Aliivibrio fischeri]|uniref:Uncharacterized protein n=1 Tax=Aliivibrio fischeri TaxID=668 RepID=A0A6N3YZC5_ALIFS|nr:hypothetical protein [Aliivibrio fischeri]MUK47552.1 hypothetical protein [Aliivibrio fischeri]MUK81542.1 hypothetical protein [Aliivibrio fischeri]MUK86588.1 hypothetical protein [Aliivibrio fischeri]
MADFLIKTDEDAFRLLQETIDNGFDPEKINIKFDGWPQLNIHLKGDKYDSSLTPSLMKGFIELQKGINRSYCLVRYNTPNTNVLSKQEREDLEIQVKVGKGSTTTAVDLQSLLTNIGEQVINKMDPTTLAITIVSLGLIWAGKTSYASYLNTRCQIRETEVKSEETRDLIKNQQFLSEQETERAKILSQVILQNNNVATLSNVANDTKAALLKELANTDTAVIQGIEVDGELAGELAKNARRTSIDIRLDGLFRILNVDSSDATEFKVRLKNVESKEEFTAKVQDGSLDQRYIAALQYGEWKRTPIQLMVNAKSLNNDIRNAIVIEAKIPESK